MNKIAQMSVTCLVMVWAVGYCRGEVVVNPKGPNELKNDSDLVIVGEALESRDTDDKTDSPGDLIGVNSTVKVLTVMHGNLREKTITVFLLRFGPKGQDAFLFPPELAKLEGGTQTEGPPIYLLYLNRSPDGRYVPVSGQKFPTDSIFTLVPAFNEKKIVLKRIVAPTTRPMPETAPVPPGKHILEEKKRT